VLPLARIPPLFFVFASPTHRGAAQVRRLREWTAAACPPTSQPSRCLTHPPASVVHKARCGRRVRGGHPARNTSGRVRLAGACGTRPSMQATTLALRVGASPLSGAQAEGVI